MSVVPESTNRLNSLDQFRGYTVAGMFLVNFLGSFAATPYVLLHKHDYISYADTIMPHFLFAVGFAFRLTFGRRVQTQGAAAAYGRMIRRLLGLALVAICVYGVGRRAEYWQLLVERGVWDSIAEPLKRSWFQTLMHIAATSLWILPVIRAGWGVRILYMLASAGLHVYLSWLFNFEWTNSNGNGIDGGPLGFLTWTICAMLGTFACDMVVNPVGGRPKLGKMFAWGVIIMALGWLFSCGTRLYDLSESEMVARKERIWKANVERELAQAPLHYYRGQANEAYRQLHELKSWFEEPEEYRKRHEAPMEERNFWPTQAELEARIAELQKERGKAVANQADLLAQSPIPEFELQQAYDREQQILGRIGAAQGMIDAMNAKPPTPEEIATLTDNIAKLQQQRRDVLVKQAELLAQTPVNAAEVKALHDQENEFIKQIRNSQGRIDQLNKLLTEEEIKERIAKLEMQRKHWLTEFEKVRHLETAFGNPRLAENPVIPSKEQIEAKRQQKEKLTDWLAEPPFVPPPDEDHRPWNYWMMSQRAGTLSYLTFAGGLSLCVYVLFYIACDIWGWQLGVFRTLGVNALAGYVLHEIVGSAVKPWIPHDAPGWYVTAGFLVFFGIVWLFLRHFEKNKIYLRL